MEKESIQLDSLDIPRPNANESSSLLPSNSSAVDVASSARTSGNLSDGYTQLRESLLAGDSASVISFIQSRKVFDSSAIVDPIEGETLLMMACRHNNLNVVRELVQLESFTNNCKKTNRDRKTALILSAEYGFVEIVELIIETVQKHKDVSVIDQRDTGGFSALMWACYKGWLPTAKALIVDGKASVNIKADNAMTCLMWASGRNHLEICQLLIEHGAAVNVTDKFGSTALFWACRHKRIEVARLLMRHAANPDIPGVHGKTSLMVAAKYGNLELVSVILSSNVNVNMIDGDGATSVMLAAKEGHLDILSALIQSGASLTMNDKKGDSVLICAVKAGRLEITRRLCESRIDINHQGQDMKTALYSAVEKQFPDIVALLLAHKADVEIAAADKNTPLLKAVKLKCAGIVELLMNSNSKLSPTDKNGDTALHIALRQRSRKIVQLLLRNPRNAKFLYRPNKQNVTPYSIDENQDQPILPQLFGTSNINRLEHGQSLVGYELYSSSLAVMLSEPTLCTPLTVGLYARWGSGKSFVVGQLKEYLSQYASQEGVMLFRLTPLVLFICCLISALSGLICTLSISRKLWFIGVVVSLAVLVLLVVSLVGIYWFSRHRATKWVVALSQKLESFMRRLSIVTNVVFSNPVSTTHYLQQLRFIVVNCPKFSGNVRPGGIIRAVLAEMYLQVETAYGSLTSRLLLIFPPNETTRRAHRFFCCLPLYIWALIWSVLSYLDCLIIYTFWVPFATWRGVSAEDASDDTTASVFIVIFSAFSALGLLIFFFGVVCRFVYLSIRPPYAQLLARETPSSVLTEEALGRLVKHHVNLLARCVHAIDAFAGTQTRFLVILDELDTYDQANVVHTLDVVHRYFASETRAPFINVLVLDPHIIVKHLDDHLASSNYEGVQMTGHDYFRSVVHLPIFLQAQPTLPIRQLSPPTDASTMENRSKNSVSRRSRQHTEPSTAAKGALPPSGQHYRVKPSDESPYIVSLPTVAAQISTKPSATLSELIGSMSAEYFSDINPRTLTRVTNICAFMARLLHASGVQFSWYNLTAWVNLTEQWPYHLSWMLVYIENVTSSSTNCDMTTPIKSIYFGMKKLMPLSDSNRFMDKSPLKLEAALNSSNPMLTLSDVVTFLRFTVNLDPYLRRIVREYANQAIPRSPTLHSSQLNMHNQQQQHVSNVKPQHEQNSAKRPTMLLSPRTTKPLMEMSVGDVCEFIANVPHISKRNIERYRETLIENNICGPVLAICNLDELQKAVSMTFGDWQLFLAAISSIRNNDFSFTVVDSVGNQPNEPSMPHREISRSNLVLAVHPTITEVTPDSYVTPDSAADGGKSPVNNGDTESIVGELAAPMKRDGLRPPISSSTSATAIQDIEATLLRRVISDMLYEDETGDDDGKEESATASFEIGDTRLNSRIPSDSDVVDCIGNGNHNSSSQSDSSTVHRASAEGREFKVTRTTLSPIISSNHQNRNRLSSTENNFDSPGLDDRQRRVEQVA